MPPQRKCDAIVIISDSESERDDRNRSPARSPSPPPPSPEHRAIVTGSLLAKLDELDAKYSLDTQLLRKRSRQERGGASGQKANMTKLSPKPERESELFYTLDSSDDEHTQTERAGASCVVTPPPRAASPYEEKKVPGRIPRPSSPTPYRPKMRASSESSHTVRASSSPTGKPMASHFTALKREDVKPRSSAMRPGGKVEEATSMPPSFSSDVGEDDDDAGSIVNLCSPRNKARGKQRSVEEKLPRSGVALKAMEEEEEVYELDDSSGDDWTPPGLHGTASLIEVDSSDSSDENEDGDVDSSDDEDQTRSAHKKRRHEQISAVAPSRSRSGQHLRARPRPRASKTSTSTAVRKRSSRPKWSSKHFNSLNYAIRAVMQARMLDIYEYAPDLLPWRPHGDTNKKDIKVQRLLDFAPGGEEGRQRFKRNTIPRALNSSGDD